MNFFHQPKSVLITNYCTLISCLDFEEDVSAGDPLQQKWSSLLKLRSCVACVRIKGLNSPEMIESMRN